MTATAVSEAGGGSFCVGVARKASIAGRAARRLRARGGAAEESREKGSITRCATHRSRASKGAPAVETRKDLFRHPFRLLLSKNARVRVYRSKQARERCVFGNERNLLDKSYERRVGTTSLNVDPAAPPHALARFLAAAAENPSQTLATKRNRPRTQREGGPEGPPSLGARCPLKRVRAISRGAVPRAWRSARGGAPVRSRY
jgi:hypothetical protein